MPPKSLLCTRSFEFRASGDATDDGRNLDGYAATFNDPTEINSWEGHFNERISPGAFKKTLTENPHVLMQYDHGRDSRVGSLPIGHYQDIHEDGKGLRVKGRMFDNAVVEPVRQAIEAGAIHGMSFRFKVTRDAWTDKDGKAIPGTELESHLWGHNRHKGPLNRDIKEVQLFECGPVAYPAYGTTSVGVRSGEPEGLAEDDRKALIEEYMRTATEEAEPAATEEPAAAPAATEEVVPEESERAEEPETDPESATLPTDPATEDAARSGTSSESTQRRIIPVMPRRIPTI